MGAPRFVMDDFWPSDLFLGGIPGAWYDPTDLSTMFQDNTGLTPVTSVEQPVGLIFDKSQGTPAARYNRLTFSEDFGNAAWAKTGGSTVTTNTTTAPDGTLTADTITFATAGEYVIQSIAGFQATTGQSVTFSAYAKTPNQVFVFGGASPAGTDVFTATADANGFWRQTIRRTFTVTAVGTLQMLVAPFISGAGTYIVWGAQLEAGSTATTYQRITSGTGGEWTPGNHASQSNAASRPTYRARYNLLTYSEEFNDASWSKVNVAVAANTTVAPDGTTTADTITAAAGASSKYVGIGPTATGETSFSFYVKAGTYSIVQLLNTGDAQAFANFDVSTGAIGAVGTKTTATIQSVGSGWYRCVATFSATTVYAAGWRLYQAPSLASGYAPSWTTAGTETTIIWGAQLLTAADVAATGNAYQRIAAATVYDTAPIFRPYLAFDGLDDSLSTSAINFTSTDKMTVFAGQSKQQDAVGGCLCELSANVNTNAGSFALFAPGSFTGGAATKYFVGLNASTPLLSDITSYPAPDTSVLTLSFDNAGAAAATQLIPRVDAATPTIAYNVANAGSGNFGNHAFFIGRRNNTSFPFNGRIYELIVRGAASSVTEIADTELWVNARTGAY